MEGLPMRVHTRFLGVRDYLPVWRDMQRFTDSRTGNTEDEIWLLEHYPVFTLGQAGRIEHLLEPGTIPVIHADRGGQVTYHGPGQLIAYLLVDLRRRRIGVRPLVTLMEQSIVDLLNGYGIASAPRPDAPGVYVQGSKIASLGLRVRHGCSFHGLSLNVAMDLEPFKRINPCGYPGLPVTQLSELGGPADLELVGKNLLPILLNRLHSVNTHQGSLS
ncbi:MAG: lipoyl(octanoyl) transferase LipB [Gammaproteobacteria bacterium]|nr:lipoyl(octanoyl) transferase LipB [Gammaproteobacteria bacterium]